MRDLFRSTLAGSECHYMAEGERAFQGSQGPNYSELYRVKSVSSNGNFKQMGRQCRLWKIGIMHSPWLVPLSCWAAEFSLCRSVWVVLKTGTTLKEIKLMMFTQASLQPKLCNHLYECSTKAKGKVQQLSESRERLYIEGLSFHLMPLSLGNYHADRC